MFLGLPKVYIPNRTSIHEAIFARWRHVTETDRHATLQDHWWQQQSEVECPFSHTGWSITFFAKYSALINFRLRHQSSFRSRVATNFTFCKELGLRFNSRKIPITGEDFRSYLLKLMASVFTQHIGEWYYYKQWYTYCFWLWPKAGGGHTEAHCEPAAVLRRAAVERVG